MNEWVGEQHSPLPHNLIQEPTARQPGGRLQEPTAIAGGGRSLCHVYTAVNGQTASGNLPPRGAAVACTHLPPRGPAVAKGSNVEIISNRGQISILDVKRVKTRNFAASGLPGRPASALPLPLFVSRQPKAQCDSVSASCQSCEKPQRALRLGVRTASRRRPC